MAQGDGHRVPSAVTYRVSGGHCGIAGVGTLKSMEIAKQGVEEKWDFQAGATRDGSPGSDTPLWEDPEWEEGRT